MAICCDSFLVNINVVTVPVPAPIFTIDLINRRVRDQYFREI